MKRARALPESPAGWDWCEACSDRLQEMEPRLSATAADEFAADLWHDEAVRATGPVGAAEQFLRG